MNILRQPARILARACDGNALRAILVIFVLGIMAFFIEEAGMHLLWDGRFLHWLDPVFMLVFIGYALLTIWECAFYNDPPMSELAAKFEEHKET